MAAPQTKGHATIVSDFAAAAQAASDAPLDFSEGSVFLATAEATAGLATWLQKLWIFALSVTRLVSSRGIWVDTFVNVFGMERLSASYASGSVQFSRFGTTGTVVVPLGTQVATSDGTQVFQVVADATNGAFSAASGGYLLLAGATTVSVTVQALVPGTGGNVAAQTITKLRSPAPIDALINPAPFTNGLSAETDPAVKARFPLFIASLARATRGALSYAVASLGLNLQTTFLEFQEKDGTPNVGMNVVFVDDGSGNPPTATVQAAANAVNAYRAFGVRIGVFGASGLAANVQMTVTVDQAYAQASVKAAVVAALSVYINGLGLGVPLRFTRLEQIAYGASLGVTNVSAVTLNGGTADLIPTAGQTIKANNLLVATTL